MGEGVMVKEEAEGGVAKEEDKKEWRREKGEERNESCHEWLCC